MNEMTPILPKMEGYIIFNPTTGLYSGGGFGHPEGPKWKKRPKIWSGIGPLKNHLNMLCVHAEYGYRDGGRPKGIYIENYYKGCRCINVATGEDALDIYEYLRDHVQRNYYKSNYCSNYPLVEVP